jgi:hypothetical protein
LLFKYSGFQVFWGPRIYPREKEAMGSLARYIIQASFSQERMAYLPEPVVSLKVERESLIIYRSKDNRQEKIFDALDWLATMCLYIRFKVAMPYFAYFDNR